MSRPIVRIKKCCFQPFRTYNAYVTISVKDKVFVVPENNSESAYVRRMQQGFTESQRTKARVHVTRTSWEGPRYFHVWLEMTNTNGPVNNLATVTEDLTR